MGKPVGSRFGQMVCKLKTGKFRLGIAFYHWTIWSPLPSNGREGPELVSKRCDFTNGTRISVSNIPYGKGTTFSDIPLHVPGNFPLERPKKVLFNLLSNGIFRKHFCNWHKRFRLPSSETNFKSIYFAGGRGRA